MKKLMIWTADHPLAFIAFWVFAILILPALLALK